MAVVEDAASKVSSFLSESRVLAERATLCKHSGCAYLCTGLAPSHCCRMCAKSPGMHGPNCAKRLLPCSTPGCGNAVTGVDQKYCCKACPLGRDHGPQCWCLPIALAADNGEDAEANENAVSWTPSRPLDDAPDPDALTCEPCGVEENPIESVFAVASTLAVAAAAAPSVDESSALGSDLGSTSAIGAIAEEPFDISDAEVAALQDEVDGNRSAIATNAAIIQALREAVQARGG